MFRILVAAIALLVLAASATPAHADPSYDLVPPRTCLAGSWGRTHHLEWRVQFGVFADYGRANALEGRLRASGYAVESFVGAWLDPEVEPMVVVSASYPTRESAQRAAERHRSEGTSILIRRFVVWSR